MMEMRESALKAISAPNPSGAVAKGANYNGLFLIINMRLIPTFQPFVLLIIFWKGTFMIRKNNLPHVSHASSQRTTSFHKFKIYRDFLPQEALPYGKKSSYFSL